ncbi:exodeoxyribonuclease VII large subunit [Aeoliella sp. ICT_H6.2]|uniref:Exodeoxyribonuclease 7 large subunit n=1 Tax=Aeoliella straminimaris TaxID=2954799 RepID=A0A9X2FBX8_9BACT|nr:exodeoxyribonuclease VII large subunit [Aeoliella straminimaris]MCO6043519.1 exodeoxyribonuclease VII large subunit [Aeoliella straminimaris]
MSSASSTNTPPAGTSDQAPLSVAQLTGRLKGLVEESFPDVWVAGEVSNFSRPQSGHCYFTLKDDQAQIRAVMWRGSASRLDFKLTDGLELVCHGRLDVYAPRGSYQLVVDRAHPQGVGALELALRQLREKLAREGLFDPERKQPLPKFPRRIGFVTSPTGAAIRDFLEVLRRRWAGVDVLVIPVRVQGDGAADEIAAGIKAAARIEPALDVLVVGRGGGSLEDLWAFNEEPVVRAVAACPIPTVSAVGHEIDVSLSDLAADVRALTPSEAAERVVPAADEMAGQIARLGDRLHGTVRRMIQFAAQRVESLAARRVLAHPHASIEDRARRVDELDARGQRAMRNLLGERNHRVAALAGKLESLSPLGVLGRGYSVTQDARTGQVIRAATELKVGQELRTRLAEGDVVSEVKRIEK